MSRYVRLGLFVKGQFVYRGRGKYDLHRMWEASLAANPGNKLLKVTDAINLSNTVKGQFNDGNKTGDDYIYDGNGNMVRDLNKGIGSIGYNHLNLPTAVNVTTNKGDGIGTIGYIYDATGTKLKKTAPGKVTEYAGNYIYENNALAFFSQPEGYVEKTGGTYKYTYQYKDHLGNIRLTYADSDGNGSIDPSTEIITEKNYYPFGLQHRGYNNVISSNSNSAAEKFKYNGKELEESLGLNLYEMDLRQYDPAIARWTSIDPITHHSMGTYVAFDNNPIFWADPSGADAVKFINDGSQRFIDLFNSLKQESKTWKKDDDDGNNNINESDECCGSEVVALSYGSWSENDKLWFENNPEKAKVILSAAAKVVLAEYNKAGTITNNDGYGDAFRHSYWMYLITKELGPDVAKEFGDMHENILHINGTNNNETGRGKMDISNNSWGINFALKNDASLANFQYSFDSAVLKKEIIIINLSSIPNIIQKRKNLYRAQKAMLEYERFGEY